MKAKTRGTIHRLFAEYGNMELVADPRLPLGALYVIGPDDAGKYVMMGSVYNINHARRVRDGFTF